MEKYNFSTRITVFDMFRFQMRHTYCCISGFIGIMLSILCLVILMLTHDDNLYTSSVLLILGGALFTVITPFNLLWKSYKIIALTPTFKEALEYQIDTEGVHVSQNEETADLPWENVIKVIETRTQLVIYNNPRNGFILPRKQLGASYEDIRQFIKNNVKDFCVMNLK